MILRVMRPQLSSRGGSADFSSTYSTWTGRGLFPGRSYTMWWRCSCQMSKMLKTIASLGGIGRAWILFHLMGLRTIWYWRSSSCSKAARFFVSISQIVGKADAKADVMTDLVSKSSPTKRGAHRDLLTEELLDFHPEWS